jgi:hypothetical protein
MEINHNNTVKLDNRPSNLEYLTHLQHARHTVEFTGRARGARNVNAVLSESDIPQIRQLLAEGYSQTRVADMFHVRQQTISSIARGKLWHHIT